MKTYNELLREEKTAALKKALKDAGFGDINPSGLNASVNNINLTLTRNPREFHETVRRYIRVGSSYTGDNVYISDLQSRIPDVPIDAKKFYSGDWDTEQRFLFRVTSSENGGKGSSTYIGYCPE